MSEPAREYSDETGGKRDDGMPVGKPFQRGASGNPRGRPRGLAHASREVLKRAVGEGEDPALAVAKFWASIYADPQYDVKVRLRASELLAERGWGKAPQFTPIEDDDPLGIKHEETEDAVERFRAEVVRLAPPGATGEAATNGSAQGEPPPR